MGKKVERVQYASMKMMRRKKVAAYARVSSNKEAMHQSLSSQISYYSRLIQEHSDWEYVGVYADEGLTGTKADRPEFQRLLSDCRDGKIDMVITKSISRFARNTVTLLNTVRELKGLGINVYFEEQQINSVSADGELLLTLLASFAQAESLSASENRKWQIRKGFENGKDSQIRNMFGYDISKEGISLNERKSEVVRDIYARFIGGQSMESIAKELRENNVKGDLGGRITGSAVRAILTNEKYTGNSLLQKSFISNHLEKKKVTNRGELPMYYAEETHEAIIDMATYEKAQERLREISASHSGRRPGRQSVFTSRIRCAKCGANYGKAFNGKTVWMCQTYKRKGRSECASKQIPHTILIEACCEVLGVEAFDEELFDANVDHITAYNDSEDRILSFALKSGEVIVKRWEYPSRSESWTPEMKRTAAICAKRKGGGKNGEDC